MKSNPPVEVEGQRGRLHREIISLALPALGSLVAEPLFTLADSAMVGHLGTGELAGLALASTLLLTIVGLCIFLAYTTTSATARKIGAGDTPGALRDGVDGMWLAIVLGCALALGLELASDAIVAVFTPDAAAVPHAVSYLRTAAGGLPGMLLVLAATGVLRGMLDTRTPLVVAAVGAAVNVALNATFIYGFHLGVAGSGLGTAVTQTGMGVVLAAAVVRHTRRHGVSIRPHGAGILRSTRAGIPLFIRTGTLRLAILATVTVVTAMGAIELASYQIINSLWALTALILDALAIAAQALVGQSLGAGDRRRVHHMVRIMVRWGITTGMVLGVVMLALAPVGAQLFTSDPQVHQTTWPALVISGVCMPLAGWVFILDGILIGAGDGRYLAWAGVITLVVYLPVLGVIHWLAPTGARGVAWLWLSFALVFMAARAATTAWRARGDAWMATATN
ncbi:MAG: MATE family efflux transporter [Bowdeniella nasicola]|nr:MATE family efflux transporter [Bowdeniella nasicola]